MTTLQPTFIEPLTPPGMRFRDRHVQQTIQSYLIQQLTRLGWVNDPVNFGGTPMSFMEFPPDENSASGEIPYNRVAITLGNEPEELEEQLGGGLYSVAYPLYVDIYGEKYSVSRSIGGDVKDCLTRKAIPLYDWTLADSHTPPRRLPGAWIEFDSVAGPRAPAGAGADGFRRYWRVVQALATTTFSDLPLDLFGYVALEGGAVGRASVGAELTVIPAPVEVDMTASSAGSASAQATANRSIPVTGANQGVASVVGDLSVAPAGPSGSPISTTPPSDLRVDAPYLDILTGSKIYDLSAYTPNGGDATEDGSPWDDFHTSSPVARSYKSSWIKYDCTVSGTATFDTIGSGYDTFLRVLDDSGTEIAFDDDSGNSHGGGSGESWLQCSVTSGTTYWIRPSPFPSGSDGSGGASQAHTHFNWSVPG